MRFTEGMTAGNERSRLFIIHRHATESLTDGVSGRLRIRVAARALGIHVNETHLRRTERTLQFAVLRVSIGGEPLAFRSPVHLVGLPGVGTAAGETQGLETHGLHGDGAR
jgi:hypothetical protein